jgi:hypothetical protein
MHPAGGHGGRTTGPGVIDVSQMGRRIRPILAETAVALVPYLAATLWFTWPLPRVVRDHFVTSYGLFLLADLSALVWLLASVAHALATDPLRVFESTAFHPVPRIIAASEHLLGISCCSPPT